MRSLLVAATLIVPIMSGCLAADEGEAVGAPHGNPAEVKRYDAIPEGASYDDAEGGQVLVWKDQERPFNTTFELPNGATMVRFVVDPGADEAVGIAMWNADTGRRRCNQQTVVDMNSSLLGPRSCSSIAFIDEPGAKWSVVTSSAGPVLPEVRIEFLFAPIDGPAANVDWTLLTKATQDLQPTTGFHLPSHDGTEMWVEVTLPEGEGPWPTVIASNPYNGVAGRIGAQWSGPEDQGTPAMWTYWTQDWAKRGYAAVNMDVRGFGLSDGCIEVWGRNEQLDQKFIVEWVNNQTWSNGGIGFYGQSYVATTPLAAAVHEAEGLDAIIMVAPVVDAYFDWHYGGVPNGESSLSPTAYQTLVDAPSQPNPPEGANPSYPGELSEWGSDMPTAAEYSAKGVCDPTLAPRANDPRATHGEFYDERDFGAKANKITAASLYTQGFEDTNVKSAMILDMWNDIEAPKLGLFGHWLHQHPARMDAEVLFLGWMEQYVKGIDLGLDEAYPDTIVTVDAETVRNADDWPPTTQATRKWSGDLTDTTLFTGQGRGSRTIVVGADETLVLTSEPSPQVPMVAPTLDLDLSIEGENAHIYAQVDAIDADGNSRLITWGYKNLALGDDYDTYNPITPGTRFSTSLPFRPTELMIADGEQIRLTIKAADFGEATGTAQQQPSQITFYGDGTALVVPMVGLSDYQPIPVTALP